MKYLNFSEKRELFLEILDNGTLDIKTNRGDLIAYKHEEEDYFFATNGSGGNHVGIKSIMYEIDYLSLYITVTEEEAKIARKEIGGYKRFYADNRRYQDAVLKIPMRTDFIKDMENLTVLIYGCKKALEEAIADKLTEKEIENIKVIKRQYEFNLESFKELSKIR